MSEQNRERPATGRELRWRVWQQLPLLLVLVALWMMMWREVSWLSVVSGVVIAFIVVNVFYLPPVALTGRINAWWSFVFLVSFLAEVVAASFHVAWFAIRPARPPSSAVVAVQLHTRSDFIALLVSTALSLIPGSIVVEVDRPRSILYLHVFGTADREAVQRFRDKALQVERRIVRAIGSRDDLRRVMR
jgi:multicomponent Na+:H+ antiporter subunit E